MDTNIKCLSCNEIETLRCSPLLDMRYDDRNEVTERVITSVLQLCLIRISAQIIELVTAFQRRI